MAKRGKKPIKNIDKSNLEDEKALLRDILEEEELLLDDPQDFNVEEELNDNISNINNEQDEVKSQDSKEIEKSKKINKKKVTKDTKNNNIQKENIQKDINEKSTVIDKSKTTIVPKKETIKKNIVKKPLPKKRVKKVIKNKQKKDETFSEDAITGLLNEQNKKFTKKRENLQRQLIKEPKLKKVKTNDEDLIHKLFNDEDNIPLPRPKTDSRPDSPVEKDFLRLGRSSDAVHKKELQNAFDRYPKIHRHKIIKSLIYTIILAICFVLIITNTELFDLEKMYNPEPILIPMIINETEIYEVVTNKTVFQNISFDEINTLNFNEEHSILGYLKYELVEVRDLNIYKHEYYIVDDLGNEIKLLKITDQFKQIFIQGNITDNVYLVTGNLENGFNNIELKVNIINLASRPSIQVEKIVIKERIIQKEILVPE